MIARRNPFEVLIGAIVIVLTLALVLYLVASLSAAGASRYILRAEFGRIDGIAAGSDVRTNVASQPFAGTGTTLIVAAGGP